MSIYRKFYSKNRRNTWDRLDKISRRWRSCSFLTRFNGYLCSPDWQTLHKMITAANIDSPTRTGVFFSHLNIHANKLSYCCRFQRTHFSHVSSPVVYSPWISASLTVRHVPKWAPSWGQLNRAILVFTERYIKKKKAKQGDRKRATQGTLTCPWRHSAGSTQSQPCGEVDFLWAASIFTIFQLCHAQRWKMEKVFDWWTKGRMDGRMDDVNMLWIDKMVFLTIQR